MIIESVLMCDGVQVVDGTWNITKGGSSTWGVDSVPGIARPGFLITMRFPDGVVSAHEELQLSLSGPNGPLVAATAEVLARSDLLPGTPARASVFFWPELAIDTVGLHQLSIAVGAAATEFPFFIVLR